ncbi:hypothetical protein F0562_034441 [Nyssa sinensis]|uniref:Uncharacterized protein n=1 Tax=Nyssa sinensis TaxID=561372 RepID=A0A5J5AFY3_9ASTE|nr:hypothetical protein F0562_034441 [Nyssa sinensis]
MEARWVTGYGGGYEGMGGGGGDGVAGGSVGAVAVGDRGAGRSTVAEWSAMTDLMVEMVSGDDGCDGGYGGRVGEEMRRRCRQ